MEGWGREGDMKERHYLVAIFDCLVLVIFAIKCSEMCNKNGKNGIVKGKGKKMQEGGGWI